jgi:hypothetical protein
VHLINKFDYIDKDAFYDAVFELINDNLLYDRAHQNVAFTPDGWEKARLLTYPPPVANQNVIDFGETVNSMVQQNIHSLQAECSTSIISPTDELHRVVKLMTNHLSESSLPATYKQKIKEQLAIIEAQLSEITNPTELSPELVDTPKG